MFHVVSGFADRLVLVTIFLNFIVMLEASPLIGNIGEPAIIRQNFSPTPPEPSPAPSVDPRICRPRTLVPALDCGCYAYKEDYEKLPEFDFLEELCLAELDDDILTGYAQCADTDFLESGQIMIDNVDEFFLDARSTCAYPEASPVARYSSGKAGNPDMDTFKLGRYISGYGRKPISLSMVQVSRQSIHRALANFCLVLADTRGVNRKKAFKECCPNGA